MENELQYRIARDDFRRARRQAVLNEITARIRGKPVDLLPFEEVRKTLKASGEESQGLQTIPLKAIVGSVGRYTDFTRDFLPRRDTTVSRWVRVKTAIRNSGVLRPIQVYKIGEVYFVLDGNHRVSVAREKGAKEIQAYVTEIHSKVNITPETNLDDLILKAENAGFLEKTHLDETCPQFDLSVSLPGQYPILIDQIELLRQRIEPNIDFEQAAQTWCQDFYTPVIKIMRERAYYGIFPVEQKPTFTSGF